MITLVNLRGVRESGGFHDPDYLFIVSLLACLDRTRQEALAGGPRFRKPLPLSRRPTMGASLWLLMRAFASGCTAMTGVEAVSNGVTAFREPAVSTPGEP